MSDNLNPLSNSRSVLIESKIWSESSHGYFTKFPQTDAEVIAHLLEIPIIKLKLQ